MAADPQEAGTQRGRRRCRTAVPANRPASLDEPLDPEATQPRIEYFHWNPSYSIAGRGRLGRAIPIRRPVNNFGDQIGPMIVDGLLRHLKLAQRPPVRSAQLGSVGSIMHLLQRGAVVWGSGVNGKSFPNPGAAASLDIRATRGPLTRAWLESAGIASPEVYGDPALLLPLVHPQLGDVPKAHSVLFVPNLNDRVGRQWRGLRRLVRRSSTLNPRAELWQCLTAIAASELVVASSLHAIIVAEALGIPACWVRSAAEPPFKYLDYFNATGRSAPVPAGSPREALRAGPQPAMVWDHAPLVGAFPSDLWTTSSGGPRPRRGGRPDRRR